MSYCSLGTGHYMHDVLKLSFGAIPCEGYPQTLSLSFYSITIKDMTGERNTQDSHEEQIHIAGAQVHTSLDEQALVRPRKQNSLFLIPARIDFLRPHQQNLLLSQPFIARLWT